MQAIATNNLTKDETLELSTLILKAGYTVRIGEKELKNSNKKVKCVIFGTSEDFKEV